MITPKNIAEKTMTEEKKAAAKNDYFAYYVGRPLSYLLTIPFLYTNISPNMISLLSIIPAVLGFVITIVCESKLMLVIAWGLYFLWNLMDGVDGNVARYKGISSSMGSVYDAMSGYAAMILSYFSMGIIASNNEDVLLSEVCCENEIYIILGALTSIFVIFPRLMMHKIISTVGAQDVQKVQNKSSYGFVKIVALNLISVSGMVQVFMLLAICFDLCGCFTIIYFAINLMIMLASLVSMFREQKNDISISKK